MTSDGKSCQVWRTNCDPPRRTLLAAGLGLGLAPWLTRAADADDDPTAIPPQSGDRFVYLTGEKKGVESGYGIDPACQQALISNLLGWQKDIPQGGVIWVFAVAK